MHAADFIHSRDEPHVFLTLDMGSISCPTTLRELRKEEGSEDNTLWDHHRKQIVLKICSL
jgi:hypothetical protein